MSLEIDIKDLQCVVGLNAIISHPSCLELKLLTIKPLYLCVTSSRAQRHSSQFCLHWQALNFNKKCYYSYLQRHMILAYRVSYEKIKNDFSNAWQSRFLVQVRLHHEFDLVYPALLAAVPCYPSTAPDIDKNRSKHCRYKATQLSQHLTLRFAAAHA